MIHIPTKIENYAQAFEDGQLEPEEQVELFQFLLDTDLYLELEGPEWNPNLYRYTAEYFVEEGLCYFVPTT
jgi:hypothetical protein